jgi:hypothetical protein
MTAFILCTPLLTPSSVEERDACRVAAVKAAKALAGEPTGADTTAAAAGASAAGCARQVHAAVSSASRDCSGDRPALSSPRICREENTTRPGEDESSAQQRESGCALEPPERIGSSATYGPCDLADY